MIPADNPLEPGVEDAEARANAALAEQARSSAVTDVTLGWLF